MHDYGKIVTKIRQDFLREETNPKEYQKMSGSVSDVVKDIARTQRKFEIKQRLEQNKLTARVYASCSQSLYALTHDLVYGSWEQLFDRQIGNVDRLTHNLATLVRSSETHLYRLSESINGALDDAQHHAARKQIMEKEIKALEKKYEESESLPEEVTHEDPSYYDTLKKRIGKEQAALGAIQEVRLLQSVHQKDIDKINFLRRHILFHGGTMHTAKSLAITTKHICDTLQQVKEIYGWAGDITQCLDAIHEGVGTLRGYTDDLHRVYKEAFLSAKRGSDEENVLQHSSRTLDPMLQELFRELEHEPKNTDYFSIPKKKTAAPIART